MKTTCAPRKPPNRKPTEVELRKMGVGRVMRHGSLADIDREFGISLNHARWTMLEELARLASWALEETEAKRLRSATTAIARVRARFAPKSSARK